MFGTAVSRIGLTLSSQYPIFCYLLLTSSRSQRRKSRTFQNKTQSLQGFEPFTLAGSGSNNDQTYSHGDSAPTPHLPQQAQASVTFPSSKAKRSNSNNNRFTSSARFGTIFVVAHSQINCSFTAGCSDQFRRPSVGHSVEAKGEHVSFHPC